MYASSFTPKVICPPSGVYFTALDRRFKNTLRRPSSSPVSDPCTTCSMINVSFSCFSPHWVSISSFRPASRWEREKDSWSTVYFPRSIRDISSTSFTSSCRYAQAFSTFSRQRLRFSSSPLLACASLVIPIMALIGVRNSWDISETRRVFSRLRRSASSSFPRSASISSCSPVISLKRKTCRAGFPFSGKEACTRSHIFFILRELYTQNALFSPFIHDIRRQYSHRIRESPVSWAGSAIRPSLVIPSCLRIPRERYTKSFCSLSMIRKSRSGSCNSPVINSISSFFLT